MIHTSNDDSITTRVWSHLSQFFVRVEYKEKKIWLLVLKCDYGLFEVKVRLWNPIKIELRKKINMKWLSLLNWDNRIIQMHQRVRETSIGPRTGVPDDGESPRTEYTRSRKCSDGGTTGVISLWSTTIGQSRGTPWSNEDPLTFCDFTYTFNFFLNPLFSLTCDRSLNHLYLVRKTQTTDFVK